MRSIVLSSSIVIVVSLAAGCVAPADDDLGTETEGAPGTAYSSSGKADSAVSPEACATCLEHGGGAGCAPRCPAGECRTCVEYHGGLACLDRCGVDEEPEDDSSEYDAWLGKQFADAAYYGSAGYSKSACYQYVWAALRSVLGWQIESLPIPATSAYQFGEWIINNPGWARDALHLERIYTPAYWAPEGSVIVWPRGACGYSYYHGHIEIALGDGTACSDFCGTIAGCTAQVFMPVK